MKGDGNGDGDDRKIVVKEKGRWQEARRKNMVMEEDASCWRLAGKIGGCRRSAGDFNVAAVI